MMPPDYTFEIVGGPDCGSEYQCFFTGTCITELKKRQGQKPMKFKNHHYKVQRINKTKKTMKFVY
jgi:hypothetical protein